MASMASSSPSSTSGSGSFFCNSNSNSNSNYGRGVRAVKFQTTTPNSSSRPTILRCYQQHQHPADPDNDEDHVNRRDMILRSSEIATIGAILNLGGKKPDYLGVQKATGSLALCPATSNCISTSENASDRVHYAPPWNYKPEEGRRSKNPVTREQAVQELLEVASLFSLYFLDWSNIQNHHGSSCVNHFLVEIEHHYDVEFWFPPGKRSIVEYRSASRLGNFDFDYNRRRVKALREALEKKGWASESSF
ncbi:hypothetical protein AKJ16_DCAP09230 [Drosera capensis]